ncbi:NAD(P)H-dependent oxidoreductase [Weissella cibaria]|uniref:Azoreductase n=1 Tax=Weissella cibaria TaxID=137591 RepID=A0A0D1M6V3_9LACO|nr:NAD(P)H-dependent oxidoreductase [Weissella cibaria]KIU19234.1 azoreductase [Weissella cibaria]KIU23791.1 azoreductase [Weissella cibaria]MDV8930072.1 NAD(P)H-dependent oxidoreductase [Weissella cibaria]MDY2519227.1 NAD(P)H-dependent oxidoreductase [Weissella cibaria]
MKIAVVFDHPYGEQAGYNEPHNRSFTSALLVATVAALKARGDEVDVIDLHADNFDPVMHKQDLQNWRTKPFVDEQSQNYFERLDSSDEIIMLFPMWWEMMPAMTKGFIDKVFAKGQLKDGQRRELLNTNTKVRVLTVSGAPTLAYKLIYGNPVGRMLKRGVFGKAGIKNFKWHNFNAEDAKSAGRQKMLDKIQKYIK